MIAGKQQIIAAAGVERRNNARRKTIKQNTAAGVQHRKDASRKTAKQDSSWGTTEN
jgi:hypothetical protein